LWRARNDLTPRPRFDGLSAAPLPLSSEERRGGGHRERTDGGVDVPSVSYNGAFSRGRGRADGGVRSISSTV
jgi:hypothetical protein